MLNIWDYSSDMQYVYFITGQKETQAFEYTYTYIDFTTFTVKSKLLQSIQKYFKNIVRNGSTYSERLLKYTLKKRLK